MSSKLQDIVKQYKEWLPDYEYDSDVMRDDDDRTARLKYILKFQLSPAERFIIITYSELGSFRELGKILGCSSVTARCQMEKIRKKIKSLW